VESAEGDVSMADADGEGADSQPTPDLVSSGDVDSPQPVDELGDEFVETVPPSAIFTLQEYDVVFGLRRTAASDALLDELQTPSMIQTRIGAGPLCL
jgi:chromatin modification-related protein VID21